MVLASWVAWLDLQTMRISISSLEKTMPMVLVSWVVWLDLLTMLIFSRLEAMVSKVVWLDLLTMQISISSLEETMLVLIRSLEDALFNKEHSLIL